MAVGMVIIGAGECGGRAALALRQFGYKGPVTLIGNEPHLPYERPPLSKEAISAADTPIARTIVTFESLVERRIDFHCSRPALAIDRARKQVLLGGGSTVAYDKLLLATGAVPRRLPLVAASEQIAYLRTLDDALVIRAHLGEGRSVAIIGGGFIGLELAASARKLGTAVTVIEAQARILMRGVPADIAAIVHVLHVDNGVEIACGDCIAAIETDGEGVRVRLASGRVIEADFAVIGIGATPVTALAEMSSLAIDNGIAVDDRLRTSDPDIFAAGDCCSFPLAIYGGRRVRLEAWRNALEQGSLAAKNMLGAQECHAAVPWFWSDQYDLSMHIAGLPDEGQTIVRREIGERAFILFHLGADGRLLAASGIGAGNVIARDIRLAEIMIATGVRPDPSDLSAPHVKLKKLLAA